MSKSLCNHKWIEYPVPAPAFDPDGEFYMTCEYCGVVEDFWEKGNE